MKEVGRLMRHGALHELGRKKNWRAFCVERSHREG